MVRALVVRTIFYANRETSGRGTCHTKTFLLGEIMLFPNLQVRRWQILLAYILA